MQRPEMFYVPKISIHSMRYMFILFLSNFTSRITSHKNEHHSSIFNSSHQDLIQHIF